MKKLSLLINKKVKDKEWLPVKVSKDSPVIFHFLFANDVFLFSQAIIQQSRIIRDTFRNFWQASGFKTSDGKSFFFSSKVPKSIKTSIQQISSICFTNKLGRYLGIPLLQGKVKVKGFHFII